MGTPSAPDAPDYAKAYKEGVQTNLEYAPKFAAAEQQMRELYDPKRVQSQLDIQRTFGPQITDQALSELNRVDPTGTAIRKQMGDSISRDLSSGYSLGPELSREYEQSIRAGQAARGNALGNSAVSAEALFKGSKALDLYNRRLANAGTYLSMARPEQSLALSQVQPDRSMSYVNPSGGQAGANFALQNYQNQLAGASGSNPWAGALGGAASGAATGSAAGPYGAVIGGVIGGVGGYFSDKRLKHKIVELYRTKIGLPISKFVYKDDPEQQEQVGVMAGDVEKYAPEHVGETEAGWKVVSEMFKPVPI